MKHLGRHLFISFLLFSAAQITAQERFLPDRKLIFEGKEYPMFKAKQSNYAYIKLEDGEIVIIDDLTKFRFKEEIMVLEEGFHYQIKNDEIIIDTSTLPRDRKVKIRVN